MIFLRSFAPTLTRARLEQLLFPQPSDTEQSPPDAHPGSREELGPGFNSAPPQTGTGEREEGRC